MTEFKKWKLGGKRIPEKASVLCEMEVVNHIADVRKDRVGVEGLHE